MYMQNKAADQLSCYYATDQHINFCFIDNTIPLFLRSNISSFYFSGFHCQFIQGHRRGLIIQNRSVWPTLFLLNVFTALKGTHLYIFICCHCSCLVPCGSPKKRPHTSPIVQFIFYFWSFEISRNILRNQKIL